MTRLLKLAALAAAVSTGIGAVYAVAAVHLLNAILHHECGGTP